MDGRRCWNRALDTSYGARLAFARSGTSAEGAVIQDPQQGPFDNFVVPLWGSNLRKWVKGDFIVDPGLLDGCPTRHVIEPGHRGKEWQRLQPYAQFNTVCPTIDNHTGSYYTCSSVTGTSGPTEPNWSLLAPNLGDTFTDGTVTWVNTGAAAYTQPVEIDGYIRHAISGDEIWLQTDRHFLCGSVEITGALTADATMTLPEGRYKRWIWNNTTGGYSLLVKLSTGNTVVIGPGTSAEMQCTGVDTVRRTNNLIPSSGADAGALQGQHTLTVSGNHALTAAEYTPGIIKTTGALGADATLTFTAPADDGRAYCKLLRNKCTGANLIITTGAGPTVTMGSTCQWSLSSIRQV